jgi:hypothetical protein
MFLLVVSREGHAQPLVDAAVPLGVALVEGVRARAVVPLEELHQIGAEVVVVAGVNLPAVVSPAATTVAAAASTRTAAVAAVAGVAAAAAAGS